MEIISRRRRRQEADSLGLWPSIKESEVRRLAMELVSLPSGREIWFQAERSLAAAWRFYHDLTPKDVRFLLQLSQGKLLVYSLGRIEVPANVCREELPPLLNFFYSFSGELPCEEEKTLLVRKNQLDSQSGEFQSPEEKVARVWLNKASGLCFLELNPEALLESSLGPENSLREMIRTLVSEEKINFYTQVEGDQSAVIGLLKRVGFVSVYPPLNRCRLVLNPKA